VSDIKRIAVFLDGTWNNVDDNTNVWRLKSICDKSSQQLIYYSAGVGTQNGEKITGGMFGIGINNEVTAAYEWLVENYVDGAQLFIFGFSRGAFTARSLAGFISKCGLLKPGSPVSLTQMFNRYRKGTAPTVGALSHVPDDKLAQEEIWIKEYSRRIPVWFQGVWDTVGALGMPLPLAPNVSRSDFAFLETDLHINDTHAYHALAIDEHRETFAPTLWVKSTAKVGDAYPPRDLVRVEQRWFVGAHANVGGGYENDLIAQIPLQWLMQKAIAHGLIFKDTIVIDGDESTCPIHDSFKEMAHGIYDILKLGKRFYRTIGVEPKDTGEAISNTINETIDVTVFDRWRADQTYRPQNVADWASRRRVDPSTLKQSVLAKDATAIVEATPPPMG
jgi:uncharacterized protein (DUF2235 family)